MFFNALWAMVQSQANFEPSEEWGAAKSLRRGLFPPEARSTHLLLEPPEALSQSADQ